MDLSLRILSLTFLAVVFCSSVISGQLFLQPSKTTYNYFTNDSFFISCYDAGQSNEQLRWLDKNEEEITATEGRIHIRPAGEEQQSLELVVEKVEMDDAGRYICSSVHNSIYFDLTVYRALSFGDTQNNTTEQEGKDASIECHVKSGPGPVVSWEHNGTKLENGSKYTVLDPSHEKHQLIIRNVSRSDAGIYLCKAVAIDSYSSQTKEFEINLRVEYIPEIIGEEEDEAYSSVGSVVNISCSADGQPAPRFFWFRDENTIHNSPDHMIFHSANESVLQMRIKSESQFGTYVCQASNVLGDKKKTIVLKEGATPVAPIVSASNEKPGKVVLSIQMPQMDNGLEVSGYKVKYALKSDPLNSTKFQEFTTSEELVLTNMNYDSQYIIQVAARNAAGHGEYSEEIIHETEALQKSSPVVTDSCATCIKITPALLLFILFIFM